MARPIVACSGLGRTLGDLDPVIVPSTAASPVTIAGWLVLGGIVGAAVWVTSKEVRSVLQGRS